VHLRAIARGLVESRLYAGIEEGASIPADALG
jgi:hypothetical protein